VLAGTYLVYLVIRMLIPAVLIFSTIRVVPANQRSAVLRTYLGGVPDPGTTEVEQTGAQPARSELASYRSSSKGMPDLRKLPLVDW
jgi:hypothetical protein